MKKRRFARISETNGSTDASLTLDLEAWSTHCALERCSRHAVPVCVVLLSFFKQEVPGL